MADRERGLPLSDEDLHRLYRLCECGRWIRRTDTEAWELHKDVCTLRDAKAWAAGEHGQA